MTVYFYRIGVMLLVCVFSQAALHAQSWIIEELYGGIEEDQAFDLVSQANGNVTHIAYTHSMGNPLTAPNVHIVQSDPVGGAVWEMVYDIQVATPASSVITFTDMSIFECVNGDFIWTTGVHTNAAQPDIMVCRTGPTGVVIWTRLLGAGNGANDLSTSIIEDPANGDIYVTGYSNAVPTAGGEDVIIIKLTGTGAPIWQSKYGAWTSDRGRCIRLMSNGDLVVVGETASVSPTWDALQLVVNSAGILQWAARYGTIFSDHEGFLSVMEHPNGRLYACGGRRQTAVNNADVYVVDSDPTAFGTLVNAAHYNAIGGGREVAWHINSSVTGTDMVMVGEMPGIFGGASDGFFHEIDANLNTLNYRVYGTPGDDVTRSIEYTPGNLNVGPTANGYWMVGATSAISAGDEHLLRSNLVGKTGCDIMFNVSPNLVSDWGSVFLSPSTMVSPVPYNLNYINAASLIPWCPGQYVGQYQLKTGAEPEAAANAIALNIELSPQPLTIGAEATLNFTLDSDAELEVVLHDMRGRQVFTLPYNAVAGANSVSFNPAGLNSGAYVLSLNGLAESKSLNVILLD